MSEKDVLLALPESEEAVGHVLPIALTLAEILLPDHSAAAWF